MATKKRAGLGRGLSALIPQAPADDRAIDVFFDGSAPTGRRDVSIPADEAATTDAAPAPRTQRTARTSTASKPAAKSPATTPAKSAAKTPAKSTTTRTSTRKPKAAAATASVEESMQSDATETPTVAANETAAEQPTAAPEVNDVDESTVEPTADATNDDTDDAPIEGLVPVPGATLRTLDPHRIVPNQWQPRHEFDEEALDELIISVREFGVLQPIVVRPLREGDPRLAEGDYELIMGERRLRATKASGRTEIPAIVRHTDDVDMLRDALLENLHRADLNPLEEASAYRQLLDDFGCTQEVLAERIGRSRPRISNTLRLLNLPVDVQRKVAAGVLSAGHARAILSVGEPAAMTQLADKIINEELSVREAEAAAARSTNRSTRVEQPKAEAPNSLSSYLTDVGERFGDRLNTRVKVTLRKTKGQITIDFASVADLRRILAELGEETDDL